MSEPTNLTMQLDTQDAINFLLENQIFDKILIDGALMTLSEVIEYLNDQSFDDMWQVFHDFDSDQLTIVSLPF